MKTFSLGFQDNYRNATSIDYMPFTLDLKYKAKKDPKYAYRAGMMLLDDEPDAIKKPRKSNPLFSRWNTAAAHFPTHPATSIGITAKAQKDESSIWVVVRTVQPPQ